MNFGAWIFFIVFVIGFILAVKNKKDDKSICSLNNSSYLAIKLSARYSNRIVGQGYKLGE